MKTTRRPIEIEFWTEMGGLMGGIFRGWLDEFNQSQSDIFVSEVFCGEYDKLQNKLMLALENGKWPVLASVDYKYVPFFAREGIFEPINTFASEGDLSSLVPGLLDDLTYQGQLYAMPFNRSVQSIVVNVDLFRTVGLDPMQPPETWEDFKNNCLALTNPIYDSFGTYSLHAAQWWFEPYVLQAGGTISDSDGNFVFNDEFGCIAAQLLQEEVHKYHYARVPDVALPHHGPLSRSASQFVQGKIGMFRTSVNMHTALSRNPVNFEWSFAMLPAGPAGRFVTSGGANFAILASASREEKEAAWEFLKWVTTPQKAAEWHMHTGYVPVRSGVKDMPEVQDFYHTHPTWQIGVNQMQYLRPTSIGVLNAPDWQKVIDAALDRIILDNQNVKTVLDNAVAQLQPVIDRARSEGKLITR